MPKILINEIDKTTPGAPDGYSNYSVLLPGFMGRTPVLLADADPDSDVVADKIQPDSNGVYEFSNVQDFVNTIGLTAPHHNIGDVSISHYGNQMAYELLKQGYSIIYLPIEPETCASALTNEKTWEIFRDKASYDFRFVCHGLLESVSDSASTAVDDSITGNGGLVNTLMLLHNKEVMLVELDENGELDPNYIASQDLEQLLVSEENYASLYTDLIDGVIVDKNLVDAENKVYATGTEAIEAVVSQLRDALSVKNALISASTISAANTAIANLACYIATGSKDADGNVTNNMNMDEIPGRGDCIALIELDENAYTKIGDRPEVKIIEAINNMSDINVSNGKYCAMTVPSVVYKMQATQYGEKADVFNGNRKFPGSFHYLTCFMNSLKSGYSEWYAAAGYTRGVSSYVVDYATVSLGEIAINALEPRNYNDPQTNYPKFTCNVIANFRGSYYLWGNRTAHPIGKRGSTAGDLVASHFLNIRQLCVTIKKQLYVACRRYTFDPNSDTLWFNFVNAIKPTLELMKADQGIRDYKILKVPTDKKAMLKAKIRIVPIEAVEDFDLEVSLEDSFGETTVVASE